MNSNWSVRTPVVFLIFNRPDTTEKVFAKIAKVKPSKLLIVADGPRGSKAGESLKCQKARDIVKQVDWNCEVITNFSDINLGCKNRVSTGIDWAFEHVEEAIILEDDCLPSVSFFRFCDEMLEKYRSDQKIAQISGSNFLSNKFKMSNPYYLSKFQNIWGWATWKRAWNSYDVEMKKWPEARKQEIIYSFFSDSRIVDFYTKMFDEVYQGKIDTWDYQWVFCNILSKRFSLISSSNLISNIGFNVEATHTKHLHPLANLEVDENFDNLDVNTDELIYNDIFDKYIVNKFINRSLFTKVAYVLFAQLHFIIKYFFKTFGYKK
jgi:hypothetical protein